MTPRPLEYNPDQGVTLWHVREIVRYNDWIMEILGPHVRGRVLELGCGIGSYSGRLRHRCDRLVCVDRDLVYVRTVREAFRDDPAVEVMEATLGGGLEVPGGSFETVVMLNLLEHIEDDGAALGEVRRWLVPGGRLLLQVPAHQWLFGEVDRALGHHRRYSRRSLKAVLTSCGFEIVAAPRYLFVLAIPGWWWVGRVRRQPTVSQGTARSANAVVTLSRLLEAVLRPPVGLTLVCVARAPR